MVAGEVVEGPTGRVLPPRGADTTGTRGRQDVTGKESCAGCPGSRWRPPETDVGLSPSRRYEGAQEGKLVRPQTQPPPP